MEGEIKKRDNILFSIGFSIEWFLRHQKESRLAKAGHEATFERGITEILEHVGFAVGASTVTIFRMDREPGGGGAKIQHIWVDPASYLIQPSLGGKDAEIPLTSPLWRSLLATGNYIAGDIEKFPEDERRFFEQAGISSIAIIPLFREDALWGFISFSSTELRQWSESEMEALRIAGNIIAALLA